MRGTPFEFASGPASRNWKRELAPLAPRSLTVLVDVSNKCNIRCRMCYFAYDSLFQRKAIYMAPESFAQLADELFPLAHTVYLSAGSEPLTSPYFVELLAIAARYDVPDLKFLTNGLLLRPEIAEAILESRVTQVHFSTEGATKATYERIRAGGEFERFTENIRHLATRKRELGSDRPILQFNVTLMRSNLGELERFVELAEELGVERIACRHVMPYEGLGMEAEALDRVPREANAAFKRFLARADVSSRVLVVNFPDLFPIDGEIERPVSLRAPGPATTREAFAPEPFGHLDLPRTRQLRGSNAIELRGWALDPTEVEAVLVARERLAGEDVAVDEYGLVPIGVARFLSGTRPDVALLHRTLPLSWRGGFTFELRREMLPRSDELEVRVHVLARNVHGRTTEIGERTIRYGPDGVFEPYLYCRRPFESVYIDAEGKFYPYPDCQTIEPFGDLGSSQPFEALWHGGSIVELRERIVARDPPRMCLTCPDFINRNVDDGEYFKPRAVERGFRRPLGFVDLPRDASEFEGDEVAFQGWALGYDEFECIEIVRDALPEDSPESRDERGRVRLGHARCGVNERPDVHAAYPHHPQRSRAGWCFALRRADLPGGRGLFTIHAIARNRDGVETRLGTRRIVFRPQPPAG